MTVVQFVPSKEASVVPGFGSVNVNATVCEPFEYAPDVGHVTFTTGGVLSITKYQSVCPDQAEMFEAPSVARTCT